MFGILLTLYAIMYVYSYATSWCTFTTDVFFNSSVYVSLRKCPWLIRRHSCSDTKEFSENFFLNYTILYFLHSKSMKNVYDWIEFLIKLKALSEYHLHIGFSVFPWLLLLFTFIKLVCKSSNLCMAIQLRSTPVSITFSSI